MLRAFTAAKHWQLFLLMFGPVFLFQFILFRSMFADGSPFGMMRFYPVVMLFFIAIFFGWLYTIGTGLQSLLPPPLTMKTERFKWFLWIPAVYIVLLCFAMFGMFNSEQDEIPGYFRYIPLILPIHLFCMFSIFHSIYFVAKALRSVQMGRMARFEDYAGEFFLLWFFPIGIWFIQPRVNRLLSN